MKEDNRNLNESAPEGVNISKKAGIALGVLFGFLFEIAIFLSAIFWSATWALILFLLYLVSIALSYVKGKDSIGWGLILSFFISLLIFGGCLALII